MRLEVESGEDAFVMSETQIKMLENHSARFVIKKFRLCVLTLRNCQKRRMNHRRKPQTEEQEKPQNYPAKPLCFFLVGSSWPNVELEDCTNFIEPEELSMKGYPEIGMTNFPIRSKISRFRCPRLYALSKKCAEIVTGAEIVTDAADAQISG